MFFPVVCSIRFHFRFGTVIARHDCFFLSPNTAILSSVVWVQLAGSNRQRMKLLVPLPLSSTVIVLLITDALLSTGKGRSEGERGRPRCCKTRQELPQGSGVNVPVSMASYYRKVVR